MLTPNLSPAQRLAANIADMPKALQTAVREGFEIAAGLSDADRNKAANAVLAGVLAGRGSMSQEIISREISVPDADAGRILVAIATTSALLSGYDVLPEEFVEAGRGVLFSETAEPSALQFSSIIIPNRPALETSVSLLDLASQVLPSLRGLSVTVDLRVRFNDDILERFVAIAIVRVDTDVDGQQVFLQMTRSDVESIIDQLTSTKKQMELAELLLNEATKSRSAP